MVNQMVNQTLISMNLEKTSGKPVTWLQHFRASESSPTFRKHAALLRRHMWWIRSMRALSPVDDGVRDTMSAYKNKQDRGKHSNMWFFIRRECIVSVHNCTLVLEETASVVVTHNQSYLGIKVPEGLHVWIVLLQISHSPFIKLRGWREEFL